MGFGVDFAKFGSKKRFENRWLSESDFRKQSRRTTVFGAKKDVPQETSFSCIAFLRAWIQKVTRI